MAHSNSAAASGASILELSAVASSFVRDVYAVIDQGKPLSPTLSKLADRATVSLTIALHAAAGRPHDDRWRTAYVALSDFIDCYLHCSGGADDFASFARLWAFLAENSDLAQSSVSRLHVVGRALRHSLGR